MRWTLMVFLMAATMTSLAMDCSRGLNVRDFGAKGDGMADDTAAVQAALDFIRKLPKERVMLARQPMLAGAPELGDLPVLGSTSESVVVPELFFPAGTYRLTATLVGSTYSFLRGEPGTILRQDVPERDLLYFDWGFRVQLRQLTFQGGRRQVMVYTGNEDTANVTIEQCSFENAHGAAIWSHNYRRPGGHDFATITMGAYTVDYAKTPLKLTPNAESGPTYCNSTNLTVSDSRFINCQRCADFGSDGSLIENCQIMLSPEAEGPALVLTGQARLEKVRGYAPASSRSRWWIEHSGIALSVRGSSFWVEGDIGMALIRHAQRVRGEVPSSIIIRGTATRSAGSGGNAVLVIANAKQENTPHFIDFSGVSELSGQTVNAVSWELMPNADRMLKSKFNQQPAVDVTGGSWLPGWLFRISLESNRGVSDAGIPDFMKLGRSPAVAPELLAAVSVAPVALTARQMEAEFPRRLAAVDFGVDLDSSTDDTAAMQRALDKAAAGEPALIEVPPVLIRLSAPLRLPPKVALTAPGLATIMQTDLKAPILDGPDQQRLWLTNLRLVSGSVGVDLHTRPEAAARILLDKCFFYSMQQAAVSCLAGNGLGGKANSTWLKIRNSVFISPLHGVVTNAAHSEVSDFWVSTNGRMQESAFIVNLGGDMLVRYMLGVPMPMKDHRFNHLPVVPDWPFAHDIRWFDNYGRLDVQDSRFGGEYYGIPLVYNYTASGAVAVDGGFTCFNFPDAQQCMLYCVANPAAALLRNVGWTFKWPAAATCKRPAANAEPPRIHVRNFLFETQSFQPL